MLKRQFGLAWEPLLQHAILHMLGLEAVLASAVDLEVNVVLAYRTFCLD
jgi:hypothetical protein